MSTAVLSIGSNLGDRLAALLRVVDTLGSAVRSVSPVYQTAPWGPVRQHDFLNAVVIADARGTGWDWLARAHDMETAAGRVRDVRWGPRTLDVDLICVRAEDGEWISDDPELTLPHPRAAQRAFVLAPWYDLEPDAMLTGYGAIEALLAAVGTTEVHRRDDLPLHGKAR